LILKILEKCAQIENIVSKIYLEFSGNNNNDKVLAGIWMDMSKDEEDHCQQLRLASRLPINESFDGLKDKCLDPNELYEQAVAILEDAKSRQFTVLDMLKTAVVLEKEFRKLHAPYALEFKDPALKETFERLARADIKHLEDLDAYLKKYKSENPV
jgi:hypothetical protein